MQNKRHNRALALIFYCLTFSLILTLILPVPVWAQIAQFKTLDKVTGRTAFLEIPVGKTARLGSLNVRVRHCVSAPPEEPPETKIYVEIDNERDKKMQRIFAGWMFASSPGLNGVEHPVYDLWSITCKTASGDASAGKE